jgi:ketosteroid isomerase-like protein
MTDPLIADRRFFAALVGGDVAALEQLCASDFIIVDVFSGSEAGKQDVLGGLASGALRFTVIEPEAAKVRRYGECAVVNGATRMRGTFNDNAFAVHSRYTHVFVGSGEDGWKLVSAQGTPIVSRPEPPAP